MGKSVKGGSSFFDAMDNLDVVDKKKSPDQQTDSQNGTTKTSPSSLKSQSPSQGKEDDSFFGAMDKIEAQPKEVAPLPVPTPITNGVDQTNPVSPVDPNSIQPSIVNDKKIFSFDQFANPVIEQTNGAPLSIDSKTIPISPYKNNDDYVAELQKRIATGKATPQDEQVIKMNQRITDNFSSTDDEDLKAMATKYQIPESPDESIDSKIATVSALKNKIQQDQIDNDNKFQQSGGTMGATPIVHNAGVPKGDRLVEYNQLNNLQTKLADEKNKTDLAPLYMQHVVSQDESGNLLNKLKNRVLSLFPQTSMLGAAGISMEVQNKFENLPVDFSFGVNRLKYTDPEQYLRLTNALTDGSPISQSQIAQVTAQGIESRENILKDAYKKQEIDKPKFLGQADNLKKSRYENIVNNPEVLRSFLSSGIADAGDNTGELTDVATDANSLLTSKLFGHTWNYSADEIDNYGKAYAQANGIDPNDARVTDALKYLKDNEGSMILDNSIAKSGYARDIAKGLAGPIRGVWNTIEDIPKSLSAINAEGQSQGNVNVSEQKVSRVQNSVIESTISDILEGTGQFITQAGLAAITSGGIAGAGEALAGMNLGATTAGEVIGTGAKIGKLLTANANNTSVFITSYAQAYDQDLKQALNYTSDNDKARISANIMAVLEGATELVLSPLEIAEGIYKKLGNKKELAKGLVDIISDGAIINKNAAVKNLLKASLHAGLATGKVMLGESLEEEVTQIADYASNAILDPKSKSFQNRDLLNEMGSTAYQTGLSMVVPALLNGVGAFNVNNFSKGSLLVAAQNRQQMLDDLNERVHEGHITQDQANEKASIINSAANANKDLPQKENGKKLNTTEKTDYIYSRVVEGILNKKLSETDDEAQKVIINKKIKEQQDFRVKILTNKKSTDEKVNAIPNAESGQVSPVNQDATSSQSTESTQSSTATEANPILGKAAETIQGAPDVSGLPPDATDATLTQKQKPKPSRNATTITKEGQQPQDNTESSQQQRSPVDAGQQDQSTGQATGTQSDSGNSPVGSQQESAKEKIKVPNYVVKVKAGANDVKIPIMKNAIIGATDEGTIKGILKEVSDQWHDEGSRSQTERDYGSKIVDIAKQMFPQESQQSLSVPDNNANGLTKEAQTLLASIKEGSKPTFITNNLERIAKENGIEVTGKMSADDVINELKKVEESNVSNSQLNNNKNEKNKTGISQSGETGKQNEQAGIQKNGENGNANEKGQKEVAASEASSVINTPDASTKEGKSKPPRQADQKVAEPSTVSKEGEVGNSVGGDKSALNKQLESLVNQIPTTELRRPNGSIGTQGFTEENLVSVARHIAKDMGFEIPAYNKDLGTSKIRQVIEFLKGNKEAQQKIKEYIIKDPVLVNKLPDNTYSIEDGNHRANLLNLIGVDVIPTIELNGRDKVAVMNEHDKAVESLLKEHPTEPIQSKVEQTPTVSKEGEVGNSALKFTTHTGETVEGKKLTDALNKVANDKIKNAKGIREENLYASHVSEAEKDKALKDGLAYAEEIRQGKHMNNLTVAQNINRELTGETVPILPKPKSEPTQKVSVGGDKSALDFINLSKELNQIDYPERTERLIKEGIIDNVTMSEAGRTVIVANINGEKVPFYRSKNGTSGKDAGTWYPFFGFGKDANDDVNGWFVKGTREMLGNHFGSKSIEKYSKLINEVFDYAPLLDKPTIIGGNEVFNKLKKITPKELNRILYGSEESGIDYNNPESFKKAIEIIDKVKKSESLLKEQPTEPIQSKVETNEAKKPVDNKQAEENYKQEITGPERKLPLLDEDAVMDKVIDKEENKEMTSKQINAEVKKALEVQDKIKTKLDALNEFINCK